LGGGLLGGVFAKAKIGGQGGGFLSEFGIG